MNSINKVIESSLESHFSTIDYPTLEEKKSSTREELNELYYDKIQSVNDSWIMEWNFNGKNHSQSLLFDDENKVVILYEVDSNVKEYREIEPLGIKVNWFWNINKHNKTLMSKDLDGNGVWDIIKRDGKRAKLVNFRNEKIWDLIRKELLGEQ